MPWTPSDPLSAQVPAASAGKMRVLAAFCWHTLLRNHAGIHFFFWSFPLPLFIATSAGHSVCSLCVLRLRPAAPVPLHLKARGFLGVRFFRLVARWVGAPDFLSQGGQFRRGVSEPFLPPNVVLVPLFDGCTLHAVGRVLLCSMHPHSNRDCWQHLVMPCVLTTVRCRGACGSGLVKGLSSE